MTTEPFEKVEAERDQFKADAEVMQGRLIEQESIITKMVELESVNRELIERQRSLIGMLKEEIKTLQDSLEAVLGTTQTPDADRGN